MTPPGTGSQFRDDLPGKGLHSMNLNSDNVLGGVSENVVNSRKREITKVADNMDIDLQKSALRHLAEVDHD